MPLDDIRVTLADKSDQLPQQVRFTRLRAGQQVLPTTAVPQGHHDDLVPVTLGVREIKTRRGQRLNVHLQPHKLGKAHAAEQPGGQQRQ